jgi:hypothetical protein
MPGAAVGSLIGAVVGGFGGGVGGSFGEKGIVEEGYSDADEEDDD